MNLDVGLTNAQGLLTYQRQLSERRWIGWQFQGGQLRLFALVRDAETLGAGRRKATARAAIAEQELLDWFDHTDAEPILGRHLLPNAYAGGEWRRFAPDFVYHYRKAHPETPTAQLAPALAALCRRVDTWRPISGRSGSLASVACVMIAASPWTGAR